MTLRKPAPLACLLAGWLVPGTGHLLLGSTRRGLQFMGAILATFAIGWWITRGHAVSWDAHPFAFVFQALTGLPAFAGGVYDVMRVGQLGEVAARLPGNAIVAVLDLGMLFTMVAGLLNLVVAHDAYDRALSRRGAL